MKQYENENLPFISLENYANLFNVYEINTENENDVYTYSINKAVYFKNWDNLAPSNFSFYTVKNEDQWTTISYNFYETVELWWLICKINNIIDPVANSPKEGQVLKIINKDLVNGILQKIRVS